MPITDKTKAAQWNRDYKRRKRIRGRTCEGCGERPAEAYYRANERVRAWVLCLICHAALRRAKPRAPRTMQPIQEDGGRVVGAACR